MTDEAARVKSHTKKTIDRTTTNNIGQQWYNPNMAERTVPTNMRKAVAGQRIMEGMTLGKALRSVGYADSTSKVPLASGLSAELCIAETHRAGLAPDLATIRQQTRSLMIAKLAASNRKPSSVSLGEVAKCFAVTEKYISEDAGNKGLEPRSFVDRMEWLAGVMTELRSRGLAATDPQHVVVDPTPDKPKP